MSRPAQPRHHGSRNCSCSALALARSRGAILLRPRLQHRPGERGRSDTDATDWIYSAGATARSVGRRGGRRDSLPGTSPNSSSSVIPSIPRRFAAVTSPGNNRGGTLSRNAHIWTRTADTPTSSASAAWLGQRSITARNVLGLRVFGMGLFSHESASPTIPHVKYFPVHSHSQQHFRHMAKWTA
jgi:hypothetical protein